MTDNKDKSKKQNEIYTTLRDDRDKAFKKENIIVFNESQSKKVDSEIESSKFLKNYKIFKETVRPKIDYLNPTTFCFYGSAQRYYLDSFERIYNYYPYDGSRLEKIQWSLSSSVLDLSILEHVYPKTTGHIKFSSTGWGVSARTSGLYGEPIDKQYIELNGGPHKDSLFNEAKRLENNLKIDGTYGNTVEFWLNKTSFVGSTSQKEVIMDVHTPDNPSGSAGYGRFLLELTSSTSPFVFSYVSGNTGFVNQSIGSTLTGPAIADKKWHHYALSVGNVSGALQARLYVDGVLSETITKAETISAVKSHHNATLGALAVSNLSTGGLAYGKLSASLDEFRYWKEIRSVKNIGTYYDKHVYGGTAEDTSNPTLGVYYKFNEGITQRTEIDSIILDYSGRLNNGKFIGYNSTTRNVESAIDLSSATPNDENKDPVIYSFHPSVIEEKKKLENIGKGYDNSNDHSIVKNLPNYAREEAVGSDSATEETDLGFLTRIISKVFDDIHLYTKNLKNLRRTDQDDFLYVTGAINNKEKYLLGDSSYYDENIQGISDLSTVAENSLNMLGFSGHMPPLLSPAEIHEDLYAFKENGDVFDADLYQIKNKILKNIHANISFIYKKKGTEESFRNLIRCFGVDTDLVNMFVYGHNEERKIENSSEMITQKKRSLSFQGSNKNASLVNTSNHSDERHYIKAGSTTPWTIEGSFLFPKIDPQIDNQIDSSLFGAHETETTKLKFNTPNDRFSFQVKATKLNSRENIARFTLSSAGSLFTTINTGYYTNVYDNTKWDLAVKFRKGTDSTFGTTLNTSTHFVDFIGHRYDVDVLRDSFHISASITEAVYNSLSSVNKAFYVGASRTDFSGSVLLSSDIKNIHLNVWNDNLSIEDIRAHALNSENIGRNNLVVMSDHDRGENKKAFETLAMRWQYDNLTASTNSGQISVVDASSGSISNISNYGDTVGYKYPGLGIAFTVTGSTIEQEYFAVPKYVQVDNALGKDNISIKSREIDKFEPDSRPSYRVYSFEKSMYQVISKQMVDFMAGVVSLNNLIGDPVNKYRPKYKLMETIKQRFFERVENDIDLDKFVEYYRWLDSSLGQMLTNLQPLSSEMMSDLKNVVESHELERNKYQHAFPTVERKDTDTIPAASLFGINELLYDWEHGHAEASENDHCLWQKERKERPTGQNRETLRRITITDVSGSTYAIRRLSKPYKYTVTRQRLLSIGSNRNANKNKDLYKVINSGKQITINKQDIFQFKKCNDVIDPNAEKIYQAKTDTTGTAGYLDGDSDLILPFSLYSSSVGSDFDEFKPGLKITNNHDGAQSIQGPFTFQVAGGMPHRKVKIGTAGSERPEAYEISSSAGDTLVIKSPLNKPKSIYSLGASTVYNIKNIKHTTSSVIGNYRFDYDIVQTTGRSINNTHFVSQEASWVVSGNVYNQSAHITGVIDFTVPTRSKAEHVFVNRFSAPGGPETAGAFARDIASGEFSIYNTLNYRNNLVRSLQNKLSSERSEKFGYRAGSSVQASIHMTPRNPTRTVGTSGNLLVSDNLFVQHQIPQNDYGYSWISASAFDSVYEYLRRNGNFGHSHNFSVPGKTNKYSLSPSQLLFVTASDRVTNLDFAGMSNIVQNTVSSSTNTISEINNPHLNDLILNRQGPYGWPSWKQLRGEQNKISKKFRKENKFSLVFRGQSPNVSPIVDYSYDSNRYLSNIPDSAGSTEARKIKNYTEIFATNKFKPVTLTKHPMQGGQSQNLISDIEIATLTKPSLSQDLQRYMWFGDQYLYEEFSREESSDEIFKLSGFSGTLVQANNISTRSSSPISLTITYQNDLSTFANTEITSDLNIEEVVPHSFDSVLTSWLQGIEDSETISELNYVETLYPREVNTFLDLSRNRSNFNYFSWNSNRSSRDLILSGNVNYGSSTRHLISDKYHRLFVSSSIRNDRDNKKSFSGNIERIDTTSFAAGALGHHITASVWPLDSRKEFTRLPVNITSSYFKNQDTFLANRDQGVRGEGSLQNDYSIFALGFNGLDGVPPAVATYNRRIPQVYGSKIYLSGESKWQAADSRRGPFYDSYTDYSDEIRRIGQDHSIVPEFKVSDFTETALTKHKGNLEKTVGDNFLSLTGAIYHSSSNNLQVGSQFFKTYSNTDFLKYFQIVSEKVSDEITSLTKTMSPTRLTLKCQAAMKFLPYRGFYPAERITDIADIFHRNYLKESSFQAELMPDGPFSSSPEYVRKGLLDKRINASKYHAMKPIFMPGVLNNSIKAGLAVDYPIYVTNYSTANSHIRQHVTSSIFNWDQAGIPKNAGITGSAINDTHAGSTNDDGTGIPRINGSISRRINFNDVLYLEDLFEAEIYDNEPHPSASLLYGNSHFTRIIERPSRFGTLNIKDTKEQLAIDFSTNRSLSINSLDPYVSAVNNFAAETVNFFLEGERLNTLVSEPIKFYAIQGVDYKMRVYLENVDTTMYDRHSAFGPPVDEGHVEISNFISNNVTVPGVAASLVLGPFNNANSYTYNSNKSILPGFKITDTLGSASNIYYYDKNNYAQLSSSAHGSLKLTASSAQWSSGQINATAVGSLPRIVLGDESSNGGSIRYYDPNYFGTTLGNFASFDLSFDFGHSMTANDHNIHPTPWHTYGSSTNIPSRVSANGYNIEYSSTVWNNITDAMPNASFTVVSGSGNLNSTAGIRIYDGLLYTGSIISCRIKDSGSLVWGPGAPGTNHNEGNGVTFQSTTLSGLPFFTLSASSDDTLELNHRFYFYRSSKFGATSTAGPRTSFINLDTITTAAGVRTAIYAAFLGSNLNKHMSMHFDSTSNALGAQFYFISKTGSHHENQSNINLTFFDPGSYGSIGGSSIAGVFGEFSGAFSSALTFMDFDAGHSVSRTNYNTFGSEISMQSVGRILPVTASRQSSTSLETSIVNRSVLGSSPALQACNITSDYNPSSAGSYSRTGGKYAQNISSSLSVAYNQVSTPSVSSSVHDSNALGGSVKLAISQIGARTSKANESTITYANNFQNLSMFFGSQPSSFSGGTGTEHTPPSDTSVIKYVSVAGTVADKFGGFAYRGANTVVSQSISRLSSMTSLKFNYEQTESTAAESHLKIIVQTMGTGSQNACSISSIGTAFNTSSPSNGKVFINDSVAFTGAAETTTFVGMPTNSGNSAYVELNNQSNALAAVTGTFDAITYLRNNNYLRVSASHGGSNSANTIVLTQIDTGSDGNRALATPAGASSAFSNIISVSSETFAGGVYESVQEALVRNGTLKSGSHGFMPFVPPYLDKNSNPYVELKFSPTSTKEYNAREIVESLEATYVNFKEPPSNANSSTNVNHNFNHAMCLSASIDFSKIVRLERDRYIYGENDTAQIIQGLNKSVVAESSNYSNFGYRWVIQSLWESPIHDFSDVPMSALNLSNNTEATVTDSPWKTREWNTYYTASQGSTIPYLTASRGMWHQHSKNLKDSNKGYYLRVEDVGKNGLASAVGLINFGSESKKLGDIASSKKIKESVVAIPYYVEKDCTVKFFSLNSQFYQEAQVANSEFKAKYKNLLESIDISNVEEIKRIKEQYELEYSKSGANTVSNIAYQLRMMDRYVVPPQFDFIRNSDINNNPMVIYFFEFTAELNSEDLSNIWQNLYPSSSNSTASPRYSDLKIGPSSEDVVYSSHVLDSSMINSADVPKRNYSNYENPSEFLQNNVRWLVFKCKYRAESNYENIRRKSIEPTYHFDKNSLMEDNSRPGYTKEVSYNWPYDYFSFVELIKLENKIDFYSTDKIDPASFTLVGDSSQSDNTQRNQTAAQSANILARSATEFSTVTSNAARLNPNLASPSAIVSNANTISNGLIFPSQRSEAQRLVDRTRRGGY